MSELVTPDTIVAELRALLTESDKGPEAMFSAELKFDQAEALWQNAYDIAYSLAEGTISDREVVARAAAKEEKYQLNFAKAELNRVKAKIRQLDSAQSNLQTQFKAISITYADGRRS